MGHIWGYGTVREPSKYGWMGTWTGGGVLVSLMVKTDCTNDNINQLDVSNAPEMSSWGCSVFRARSRPKRGGWRFQNGRDLDDICILYGMEGCAAASAPSKYMGIYRPTVTKRLATYW